MRAGYELTDVSFSLIFSYICIDYGTHSVSDVKRANFGSRGIAKIISFICQSVTKLPVLLNYFSNDFDVKWSVDTYFHIITIIFKDQHNLCIFN